MICRARAEITAVCAIYAIDHPAQCVRIDRHAPGRLRPEFLEIDSPFPLAVARISKRRYPLAATCANLRAETSSILFGASVPLMSVRRGRPATTALGEDEGAALGDAIAELDAVMAAADRLTGQRRIAAENAVE